MVFGKEKQAIVLDLRTCWVEQWESLRTADLLDGVPQEPRFCVLLTLAGQAGQTPGSLNLLQRPICFSQGWPLG